MSLIVRVFGIILVAFVLQAWGARAAGWTQPKKKGYAKLWTRTLVGSVGTLADGKDVELEGTYVDTAFNFYGEYGYTDHLTFISFGTPIGWAGYQGSNTAYMGHWAIGVRYGRPIGDFRLAFEMHGGYTPPVGNKPIIKDNGKAYFWTPTVETARVDAELQVGYPLPFGWTAATTGIRWYSRKHFDPAFYSTLQVGYESSFGLVADLHLAFHYGLGEINKSNISGAGETRYLGYGLALSYWFSRRWAVVAGVEGAFWFVANARTPSIVLGFEHR